MFMELNNDHDRGYGAIDLIINNNQTEDSRRTEFGCISEGRTIHTNMIFIFDSKTIEERIASMEDRTLNMTDPFGDSIKIIGDSLYIRSDGIKDSLCVKLGDYSTNLRVEDIDTFVVKFKAMYVDYMLGVE